MSTDTTAVRCNCRRKAATNLRCSRCDTPICPDCSVPAPVGMLCRECSSPRKIGIFQVNAGHIARAFGACLVVALLAGWLLMDVGRGFGFFALWGALFYGGLIAEVGLRVTGRKRGREMEIVVGLCAGLGLLAPVAVEVLASLMVNSPVLMVHTVLSVAMLAIGVGAAVSRIRYM